MLPKKEQLEYIKREKNYIGSDFAYLEDFVLERKWEEDQLSKFGTGRSDTAKKLLKICDCFRQEPREV